LFNVKKFGSLIKKKKPEASAVKRKDLLTAYPERQAAPAGGT
jgi:hypothetical protein